LRHGVLAVKRKEMKKPFTIGITGGSGSGKTYFLQGLSSSFKPNEICLISQDNYYKPRDQQPIDENGVKNFDLPISIDREEFQRDLLKLKSGQSVTKKEYVFNNPLAEIKVLEFKPAPILVVEGLFVQYFEEISNELDLRVFIEAKDHVKLGRRIKRDQVERGYDIDDVLYRYQYHVMPVYEQLIEPLKHNSDLVIPNNSKFERALDVLVGYLKSKVSNVAN
jgi:uridine kinase